MQPESNVSSLNLIVQYYREKLQIHKNAPVLKANRVNGFQMKDTDLTLVWLHMYKAPEKSFD